MGAHDWNRYGTAGHRLVGTTIRVAEKLAKAADRSVLRAAIVP